MYTEEDIRRLKWQSRRGMLELDLLFVPFMENSFSSLEQAEQDLFVKLLDCEDQELFLWLMKRTKPEDSDMQKIVDIVLGYVQSSQN